MMRTGWALVGERFLGLIAAWIRLKPYLHHEFELEASRARPSLSCRLWGGEGGTLSFRLACLPKLA